MYISTCLHTYIKNVYVYIYMYRLFSKYIYIYLHDSSYCAVLQAYNTGCRLEVGGAAVASFRDTPASQHVCASPSAVPVAAVWSRFIRDCGRAQSAVLPLICFYFIACCSPSIASFVVVILCSHSSSFAALLMLQFYSCIFFLFISCCSLLIIFRIAACFRKHLDIL